MRNKIIEYQKVYKSIINDLSNNSNVLGVTVFGSMVAGDVWEDSDIDLFVILNEVGDGIKDIYGEKSGISIHLKIMSKDEFLNFTDNNIGGSTIHRKFISSKLVVCNDSDISDNFTRVKYYNDVDRERWNLVYLGSLLKDINSCKKYIHNGKLYSPFTMLLNAIDNFSKLYLNYNGYLISKSSISILINLNDDCEILINNLMKDINHENIDNIIRYIEEFLNKNISSCCNVLLDFLCENLEGISSREMKYSELFKGFDIEFEEILGELFKRGIVEKNTREYKSISGQALVDEKIYKINLKQELDYGKI